MMQMIDFSGAGGCRVRVILAVILGIVLIGLSSIWIFSLAAKHQSKTSTPTATVNVSPSPSNNTPISPLIFGSNLNFRISQDQVLTSPTARSLLRELNVSMLRIPMYSGSDPDFIQAARITKSLGATPLVILPGVLDPTVLSDDRHIIQLINTVFGNETVYYEYDDEPDLVGTTVDRYTDSWNSVIPQLKQQAPHGHFVGPVTYRYDQNYLTTFLMHANPRPGAVSWHEYACDDAWAKTQCLANIAHWTTHITNARTSMTTTLGAPLPIMISEWNYAANPASNDGKSDDSNFMTTWTTQAIQTLVPNRIFAAMQYSCTGTATSLIGSDHRLTVQGMVFQRQYERFILQGQQPTPTTTPTPTPLSTPTPTPMPTPLPTPTSLPTPTPTPLPAPTSLPTPKPTPTPIPTPQEGSARVVGSSMAPCMSLLVKLHGTQPATYQCQDGLFQTPNCSPESLHIWWDFNAQGAVICFRYAGWANMSNFEAYINGHWVSWDNQASSYLTGCSNTTFYKDPNLGGTNVSREPYHGVDFFGPGAVPNNDLSSIAIQSDC